MDGFEAMVTRHQRRVYSFAHYFLGNREEAEDVMQEVFLKFWRHRRRVDLTRAESWLLRATRNACFDRLRTRRSASCSQVLAVDTHTLERQPSSDPDPEILAQRADLRRRLLGAMHTLDEPLRSVLILREIQGMRYHEISEILELPLNTVRVYIHRGRRRLRKQLRGVHGDVSTA